jgi:hypothetical protein
LAWSRLTRQAERFYLLDDQAELILQGLAARLAAGPTNVQMRAAPTPIGDREDLAGREPAKAEQRNRHPKCDPHQNVAGCLHSQVQMSDSDQDDQRGRHPLAGLAPAALRDQAVEDPDQHQRQRRQLR